MTVVHTHQMPVLGEPHIALDPVGALEKGELIGGKGVLWTFGRRAPVCHHERVTVEVLAGSGVTRVHTTMLPGSGLRTQPERRIPPQIGQRRSPTG